MKYLFNFLLFIIIELINIISCSKLTIPLSPQMQLNSKRDYLINYSHFSQLVAPLTIYRLHISHFLTTFLRELFADSCYLLVSSFLLIKIFNKYILKQINIQVGIRRMKSLQRFTFLVFLM